MSQETNPIFRMAKYKLDHLIEKKGKSLKLGDNLNLLELNCGCNYSDCNFVIFESSTVNSYNQTRKEFGDAIFISSGHRCQKHNYDVGGVDDSRHMRGQAHDLKPRNGDFNRLKPIAEKHYKVVLDYGAYLHCHNDE